MWMLKIGTLFVIGAELFGGVNATARMNWKQKAELPRPVAGYMAGVSRGDLVIIGGSYWKGGKKERTKRVQIYNPRTDSWSDGHPLPQPRSDGASATLNNDIYIFGGETPNNKVRRDALVLRNGTWRLLPEAELPQARMYATAITYAGSIYLLGGMSSAHDYRTASNKFWRWHPGKKGWQALPSLPGPGRINFAMAEVGGNIYVFGGATAAGSKGVKNLDDAYRFSPTSEEWTRLPDLPVANRSWWAVGLGDTALLLAGYTDDYARAVYQFTPGKNLQPIGLLPHALADAKFYLIGDIIIGTGGESAPGIRGKWTLQAAIPRHWLKKQK